MEWSRSCTFLIITNTIIIIITSRASTAAFNNANLAYVAQIFGDNRQFAEGDHMVSLGDDVQDVVWTPRGARGTTRASCGF